jgi:hypothetical protein
MNNPLGCEVEHLDWSEALHLRGFDTASLKIKINGAKHFYNYEDIHNGNAQKSFRGMTAFLLEGTAYTLGWRFIGTDFGVLVLDVYMMPDFFFFFFFWLCGFLNIPMHLSMLRLDKSTLIVDDGGLHRAKE